jgi:hypothetical protein
MRTFGMGLTIACVALAGCHGNNGGQLPEPREVAEGIYRFGLGRPVRGFISLPTSGVAAGDSIGGSFAVQTSAVVMTLKNGYCSDHSGGNTNSVTFSCSVGDLKYELSVNRVDPVHGSRWSGPGYEVRSQRVCARSVTRGDGTTTCVEWKMQQYSVPTQVRGNLIISGNP